MILINGIEVEFGKFPNGETLVPSLGQMTNGWAVNTLSFRYESDGDLIELMMVKNYLDAMNITVSKLLLYYMPYSRMDRSEGGSPFTLRYVSSFINNLRFNKVTVIEPHSDVTLALLDRSEPWYINFDLLPKVIALTEFDVNHDYLVFPDAGAQKRYSKMIGYNTLVGFKHRNFKTGNIEGLEIVGNQLTANGRKAIIVDDLSSYGGTFKHTSIELKKLGIEEVYLLVAHAENSVFKKDLFDHIDGLFTTDSLVTEHEYWINQKLPLRVFPIQEVK